MADRENHYERAFEEFLRGRRIPYIAVDEARRSLVEGGSLKSLDFIVPPPGERSWLVDVKGRRFPSGEEQKQYWKNWSPREDLASLARWENLFGEAFRGLFVFAYHLLAERAPVPAEELFAFRGERYAFVAIALSDYARHARPISARWDTVAMPTPAFRTTATSLVAVLEGRVTLTPPAAERIAPPAELDF